MDGVQLPQGYSHFEEAVYFLPFSSQKFLVLILSTSEGWKAESTLKRHFKFSNSFTGKSIDKLHLLVVIKGFWHFQQFSSRVLLKTICQYSKW